MIFLIQGTKWNTFVTVPACPSCAHPDPLLVTPTRMPRKRPEEEEGSRRYW